MERSSEDAYENEGPRETVVVAVEFVEKIRRYRCDYDGGDELNGVNEKKCQVRFPVWHFAS